MDFPIIEVPVIGGGFLIGIVATIHVLIANFVVGGTVFALALEVIGIRRADPRYDALARQFARMLLIMMAVIGSVTGVGIWFAIMGVAPTATVLLLKIFFWPLAVEYLMFVAEIAAITIYYYRWDHYAGDKRRHLAWGIVACGAAWASMAIINCLLTFQLTSGDWPQTRSLWDACFNPSMLPALFHRALGSLAVTGVFALILATRLRDDDFRSEVIRFAALWVIVPTVANAGPGLWYLASVNAFSRYWILGGSITLSILWVAAIGIAAAMVVFVYLGARRDPGRFGTWSAAVVLAMILTTVGLMESTREAIRRPYVIDRYLYSNGILADRVENYNRTGILPRAKWGGPKAVTEANRLEAGRALFRLQCGACHTVEGMVGISYVARGRNEEELDTFLARIDAWHPFMPLFIGTIQERRALAAWLAEHAGKPFAVELDS